LGWIRQGQALPTLSSTAKAAAKQPGWEELTPMFMLTPNHIGTIMSRWARTGSIE
jgi:hypothetical protein